MSIGARGLEMRLVYIAPTIRYDVSEDVLFLFFEDGSLTDRMRGVGARGERRGELGREPNMTRLWSREGEEGGGEKGGGVSAFTLLI